MGINELHWSRYIVYLQPCHHCNLGFWSRNFLLNKYIDHSVVQCAKIAHPDTGPYHKKHLLAPNLPVHYNKRLKTNIRIRNCYIHLYTIHLNWLNHLRSPWNFIISLSESKLVTKRLNILRKEHVVLKISNTHFAIVYIRY